MVAFMKCEECGTEMELMDSQEMEEGRIGYLYGCPKCNHTQEGEAPHLTPSIRNPGLVMRPGFLLIQAVRTTGIPASSAACVSRSNISRRSASV